MLERRWQQAESGEGGVVLLSGEARDRQVAPRSQALIDRLRRSSRTPACATFCSAAPPGPARLSDRSPSSNGRLGFGREDTTELPARQARGGVALATNDLGEAAPLLAALLSLPIGERYPPLNLTPQRQKEKNAAGRWWRRSRGWRRGSPVLMLFEDAPLERSDLARNL